MPAVVIFLGPSLDAGRARAILGTAEYRPPAKRGDILRAVEDGADIIGLIDGVFFQDCSVAHKEILAALKAGVTVVGASSMGALRACEMDTLGMIGIGRIYRMYRDGILISDDEVALACDPFTDDAVSEAMVDIRITCEEARARGVICGSLHDLLINTAEGIYYPERTYRSVIRGCRESADPDELDRFSAWVERSRIRQKEADAVEAIEYIAGIGAKE
ncbi:MAG TPA: TfuA-related McrA-glycine thioamidation protein [Methanoculleus sp.]|nr:TfuA-related McrA-glycine thioamidation protein [Methanoculleus sp.]